MYINTLCEAPRDAEQLRDAKLRFGKSEHKTMAVVRIYIYTRDALLYAFILIFKGLSALTETMSISPQKRSALEYRSVSQAARPGNQDKCSQVQSAE